MVCITSIPDSIPIIKPNIYTLLQFGSVMPSFIFGPDAKLGEFIIMIIVIITVMGIRVIVSVTKVIRVRTVRRISHNSIV